jgi:hypothetical protein
MNTSQEQEKHWVRLTPKGLAIARMILIGVPWKKALRLADKRFAKPNGEPNSRWVSLWNTYLKWRLTIRRFFGVADAQ